MTLPTITPQAAKQLVDQGAVLVDIRELDEHRRERVPGARHEALSRLAPINVDGARSIVFHCRSGARTQANAQRLADAARCEAYILEGGLEAWRKAGLPVTTDHKQPIEVMRQVQIAAGSLVVIGAVLALTVSPAFIALSAFVGAGLVFAGASGWCGMAKLLAVMPWNRAARSAAA